MKLGAGLARLKFWPCAVAVLEQAVPAEIAAVKITAKKTFKYLLVIKFDTLSLLTYE